MKENKLTQAYHRLADAQELYPPSHPEIQKRKLMVQLLEADRTEKADGPGYSVHRGDCPYEHGGVCTCQ